MENKITYRVSQKKVYNRILVVVAVGSLVNARLQGDGQLHEDSVHWLKIMLHTSPSSFLVQLAVSL